MPLYSALFSMSTALKKTMRVPKGTCQKIQEHVDYITEMCGLTIDKKNNIWNFPHTPSESLSDRDASSYVREHNTWVRQMYADMAKWSENQPEDYEEMTPEFMQTVWHGFSQLRIDWQRWDRCHYEEEMNRLFNVMRGEDDDEIHWQGDLLTPRQAAEVIHLFESYLDKHDIRLELPHGWTDQLISSDEYEWCPKHGAIEKDEVEYIEDENGFEVGWKCPVEGCDEQEWF